MTTNATPLRRSGFRAGAFLLAAALLVPLAAAPPALAGEGGGSHYMPGLVGDFAMALIGPPGFYLRDDLMFFRGTIQSVTLGDRIYSSASQTVWVNVVKGIYLSKDGILGGRAGFVVALPLVIDASASGAVVSPFVKTLSGSRSGIGDPSATGFLNWTAGNNLFSAGLTTFFPLGSYDADRIINLGRNYWSFDAQGIYTWLDPKRGHEISFITGFMFNTTNGATDYSSGTEWHTDFMFAQHFSKEFALGIEGYYLKGISNDSGPLLDQANKELPALGLKPLGGFRAMGFGLGPAILYAPKIGNTDVNFIAKYLFDIDHENRFNSNYATVTAAFRF
jgi:hypothetical protein